MNRFSKLSFRLSPALIIVLVFAGLAFKSNVPTSLTAADQRVFASIGLKANVRFASFDDEIAWIRKAQTEVFARAPLGEGIADNQTREPADLMERVRHGLCFDRARSLDKAFTYMGFESRHVYLLFRQKPSFIRTLFTRASPSHAVTEVKTSRGWMMVDSNSPWIALTPAGAVVNADEVWKRAGEFGAIPQYLRPPYWAIRGMYSRKGHLYSRISMFPEFNWSDFMRWLL